VIAFVAGLGAFTSVAALMDTGCSRMASVIADRKVACAPSATLWSVKPALNRLGREPLGRSVPNGLAQAVTRLTHQLLLLPPIRGPVLNERQGRSFVSVAR
jgi:hypothetical protein